jgi:MFS family permease
MLIILGLIMAILGGLLGWLLVSTGLQGWAWALAFAVLCLIAGAYAFLLALVDALTKGREDR